MSTWSALSSPRVVELFGVVREGPTVVLFMDLKPGKRSPPDNRNCSDSFRSIKIWHNLPACLAQLLKETNSVPEDLALHYLHQTLGALEHLHSRKVLHLDVKGTKKSCSDFLSYSLKEGIKQTLASFHLFLQFLSH